MSKDKICFEFPVVEIAKSLQTYCLNRGSCNGCPFQNVKDYGHCVIKAPAKWGLKAVSDDE